MKRKLISLMLALVFAVGLVSALPVTAGASGDVSCTSWWCSDGTDYITWVKLDGKPMGTSLSGLTSGETVTVEVETIKHFRGRSVSVMLSDGSYGEPCFFEPTEDPSVSTAQITVPDGDFQLVFSVESLGYVVNYYTDKNELVESVCYEYDTAVTVKAPGEVSPPMDKPGYTFTGWNTVYNGSGDTFQPGDTIQAENRYARNTKSLFARWEKKEASGIDVENGTADKTRAEKGETVSVTAAERENYTFSHWQVITGDVTLADTWSSPTTFVKGEEYVSLKAMYRYTGPLLTDFNVSITPPVAGEHPQAPTVESEDYEVSAYSWVWITSDGSGKMAEGDVFEGGSHILYQCKVDLMTKVYQVDEADKLHGYVNGESTTSDGIEVKILRSNFMKVKVVGSYNCDPAPEPYTVTFDANGGVIRGTEDTSAALKTKPDGTIGKMPTPAREGASFEGWFTEKEGGEKIGTGTVFSGDATVYARWKEDPVTPPDQPDPPADPTEPTEPVGPPETQTNPFVDVKEGAYYHDPVLWAFYADPQITDGMDDTHFGPNLTVTRGQCVTFLWRTMGKPEPAITRNPFTDVPADQYYYKAVLWAVEKGITDGMTDTTFEPDTTLSTAHIITFLYRTMSAGTDGWYQEAADWAVRRDLLVGTGLTVAPNVNCPRGAVVTFLYRATD